jgi:hypothetical protein
MGTVTSIFAPKQIYSVDEQNKIREIRRNFNDVIQNYHKRSLELKEKSELTPESTERILSLNNEALDWLSHNPSASILELQSRQDKYTTEVKDVLETDRIKAIFIGFYKGLLYAIEKNDKIFNAKEKKKLTEESAAAESWFGQNKLKANRIQLEQYIFNAQTRTVQAMENTTSKKILMSVFEDLKKKNPAKIVNDLEKIKEARETLENNRFDFGVIFDTALGTATKVILGFLIFLIFLFSGSLAANSVIYRSISVRVLYFIYGMFPLFVIPIFIYFAIKRVREGPLQFYGVLPIIESTEEIENTRSFFDYYLRTLFVYYPDDKISVLKNNYANMVLSKIISENSV